MKHNTKSTKKDGISGCRHYIAVLLLLICLAVCTGSVSAAGVISIDTTGLTAVSGETIQVPVNVTGAENMCGYQITITGDRDRADIIYNRSSMVGSYTYRDDTGIAIWSGYAQSPFASITGSSVLFYLDVTPHTSENVNLGLTVSTTQQGTTVGNTVPVTAYEGRGAVLHVSHAYNVVIDVGILNGTVTSDKSSAQLGDLVTLTATPDAGYQLDTLTVTKETGGLVTVTDSTFTMPAENVTVSAAFTKKNYDVVIAEGILNGTVTADKTTAQLGDLVTLTAAPDVGYRLDTLTVTNETGGLVTVTDGKFTMPAENVTVSAVFSKIDYLVGISSGILNGTVTSDKTTAQLGDTVTLTAVPETGYKLSSYTVTKETGGAVTVTDGTFTMPAENVTVSAAFTKKNYDVVIAEGILNGTVTADKSSAQFGDLVTLTAAPETGYRFVSYTVTKEAGGTVTVTDSTFTMPAENVTVSAIFSKIDYLVGISSGILNGTVTSDKTTAQIGDTVTLTAVPDTGYKLSSYTVTKETGGLVTVTDGTFTMPADNVSVSAVFNKIDYVVDIAEILNGAVTSDKTTAQLGDIVTLTAEPDEGYKFVSYAVTKETGVVVTVTDGTFTMPAENVTVSAIFSKIDYVVGISSGILNGTVTSDKTTAQIGDTVTLTAVPDVGYQFGHYTVTNETGGEIPVTNSAFIMPPSNVTVWAEFTPLPEPELIYPPVSTVGIQTTLQAVYSGADTYTWNVDGTVTTETKGIIRHTFNSAGYHTVSVNASNSSGISPDASVTITINPEKSNPQDEIILDPENRQTDLFGAGQILLGIFNSSDVNQTNTYLIVTGNTTDANKNGYEDLIPLLDKIHSIFNVTFEGQMPDNPHDLDTYAILEITVSADKVTDPSSIRAYRELQNGDLELLKIEYLGIEGGMHKFRIWAPGFSDIIISEEISSVVPPTPTPTYRPSGHGQGQDTGSGNYKIYERYTDNGGYVSFGTSPVVMGVSLPDGSAGQIVLNIESDSDWLKSISSEYLFDITVHKMGDGTAKIEFKILNTKLEKLGLTSADICMYHRVGEKWIKLKTEYTVGSNGYTYYTSYTDSFSPFKIVVEKNSAAVSSVVTEKPTAVITQTAVESTPTPAVPTQTSAPTKTASPLGLIGLAIGLGAAGLVIRRK